MITRETDQIIMAFGPNSRIAVGFGEGTTGIEKTPCMYVTFQQLKDNKLEIGKPCGDAEVFGPRLFVGFAGTKSVDAVIDALKKIKTKLRRIPNAR